MENMNKEQPQQKRGLTLAERGTLATGAMLAGSTAFAAEAVDVSAGIHHSSVVTNNGHLYTWGSGHLFILGHGDCDDHNTPHLVVSLLDHHVALVLSKSFM